MVGGGCACYRHCTIQWKQQQPTIKKIPSDSHLMWQKEFTQNKRAWVACMSLITLLLWEWWSGPLYFCGMHDAVRVIFVSVPVFLPQFSPSIHTYIDVHVHLYIQLHTHKYTHNHTCHFPSSPLPPTLNSTHVTHPHSHTNSLCTTLHLCVFKAKLTKVVKMKRRRTI